MGGKTASDFVEPDTRILADGTVIGTLKYVSGYKDFSEDPIQQSGNFFPISFGEKFKGKTIKFTGLKNHAIKEAEDTEWLIRLSSPESGGKFECDGEEIVTLRFNQATLEGPAFIPGLDACLGDANGGKSVSSFLSPGARIIWNGPAGKPEGKVKYVAGYSVYPGEQQDGHFFPIAFNEGYYGKQLHVGGQDNGDSFTGGKEITPSKDDPFLIVRIENITDAGNKVTVYDSPSRAELFTLDFASLTLDPPKGKDAVKDPGEKTDFGSYGKASDYISDDVTIEWDGINGTVMGDIKYKENASNFTDQETKSGHYYPLVLNGFFKDHAVTVNGKTQAETDWIICLNKIMKEDKKLRVAYKGMAVAVLDFRKAELKEKE